MVVFLKITLLHQSKVCVKKCTKKWKDFSFVKWQNLDLNNNRNRIVETDSSFDAITFWYTSAINTVGSMFTSIDWLKKIYSVFVFFPSSSIDWMINSLLCVLLFSPTIIRFSHCFCFYFSLWRMSMKRVFSIYDDAILIYKGNSSYNNYIDLEIFPFDILFSI